MMDKIHPFDLITRYRYKPKKMPGVPTTSQVYEVKISNFELISLMFDWIWSNLTFSDPSEPIILNNMSEIHSFDYSYWVDNKDMYKLKGLQLPNKSKKSQSSDFRLISLIFAQIWPFLISQSQLFRKYR